MIRRPCEICGFSDLKVIHLHHMHPRAMGGSNHPSNLCSVCPTCHSLIHAREIVLEGWFATTAGLKLFWHRKYEPFHVREGYILKEDGTIEIR
jgi:hypothetical protein